MSEWSAVPLYILEHVTDVHLSHQDRVAAADTCRAWRQPLNDVRVVQPQPGEQAVNQQWTILKSSAIVGQVKLTSQSQQQDSESPFCSFTRLSTTAWAPFFSIQPSCTSLAISAFLSSSLHRYKPQLTQLQHLTMQWIWKSEAAINNPLYKQFPDLKCLSQLQTLHIQMHNDSDREGIRQDSHYDWV